MPRQSRRSAPVKQQTRQASTMPTRQAPPPAAPTPAAQQHHTPAPTQQHSMTPATPAAPPAMAAPQQPGLFAQMATTAAGVAVGSAVGHTLANGVSSLFSGSDDKEQPQQQQQYQAPPQFQQQQYQAPQPTGASCEADAKAFTRCLEASNNDMSACQWYLEALKSCQQMASNY